MMPHAAIRLCGLPRSSQHPLMRVNPLRDERFSPRSCWERPESKSDSKHSAHTVPRRVESCSAFGAANEASIDAVPSGRPAKVGRTASSAGGLWELLRRACVPVESRVCRTESRFWRAVAAQSRRVCEKAFPLEVLELVVECLPPRRKGGADAAAQQRMGWSAIGGCATNNPSAGREVSDIFTARRLGAASHLERRRQRLRPRPAWRSMLGRIPKCTVCSDVLRPQNP